MIEGRTPEITVKFSEKPFVPEQGKKVLIEVKTKEGMTIRAEVNGKTLRKQAAKMDSFEDWVGALSGKVKSLSSSGVVELDSAGVTVFEKKKKEPQASEETPAAS